MARFALWPSWLVSANGEYFGWLAWQPGRYLVLDMRGKLLDEWVGPKELDATTQPSKTARSRAERVLNVPKLPKG